MSAAERLPICSEEEYLALEQASDVRHEYLGGFLHAMAGARNLHNRVATNAVLALGTQLRGKRCEVFGSDVKVRIRSAGPTRFYYPDVSVVCDPNDDDSVFNDRPVVIVEVLSASTRRIDVGEKRDAYLTIPSLRAYLLVEPDRAAVTVYRRVTEGTGEAAFAGEFYSRLDATVPLSEVDIDLPLADLYDRVEFPPPQPPPEGTEPSGSGQ